MKRQLDGVVINEDKCKAIITGKQRLALEHLVVGQGHLPPEIVAFEGEQQISRGIFITDRYDSTHNYFFFFYKFIHFSFIGQLCKERRRT